MPPASPRNWPKMPLFPSSSASADQRQLRSPREIIGQAGPVPAGVAGLPLRLSRTMRARLFFAVRALLADPRVAGQRDVTRLAAVVLVAKADHRSCRTRIRVRELGRWLGVSESTVDHEVLPAFRRTKAVMTRTVTDAQGRVTGVECRVAPLWEARDLISGPMALTRSELATLLRLLEALFAPGWGERATPAGLLAGRQGRGAATDRLALLLLALQARPDGTVPLVGGSVARGRGRGAATLARLLGCSVSGGGKVLTRLRSEGVVVCPRRERASGLLSKSRLVLPAVAAAHGRPVVDAQETTCGGDTPETWLDLRCRCGAETEEVSQQSELAGEGCRQGLLGGPGGAVDQNPATAPGDLDSDGDAESPGHTGSSCSVRGRNCEISERPAAADLHTDHTPVVELDGDDSVVGGFSGGADMGNGRRPERAGAQEVDRALSWASDPKISDRGGPLRGERPASAVGRKSCGPAVGGWPVPVRPVDLPVDLTGVLAPVGGLWAGIERVSTRRWLASAVRAEVARMRGVVGSDLAEQVVAERLERRWAEQGRPVVDAVGWLLKRGLPQRAGCWSLRCDDGVRMDTREACASCQSLIGDCRARRQAVAREVHSEQLAGRLPREEVPREVERRLRETVRTQLAQDVVSRERAVVERTAREAVWAEQRQALAEAERARAARSCVDCGVEGAGGLCLVCSTRRAAWAALAETVDLEVACGLGSGEDLDVPELWKRCEAEARRLLEDTVDRLRAEGAHECAVAYEARWWAKELRDQRRKDVLRNLAGTREASAEAERAYAAALRRYARRGRTEAEEHAREAASAARERAAERLLQDLLIRVRVTREAGPGRAERSGWRARFAALAQDTGAGGAGPESGARLRAGVAV